MTQTINKQIEFKSVDIEKTDVYEEKLKKIFFSSLKKWNNEFNLFKSHAKKSKSPEDFQTHETKFKKYVYNERMEVFLKIYSVFKLVVSEQKLVDGNFLKFLIKLIEKAKIKLKQKNVRQY